MHGLKGGDHLYHRLGLCVTAVFKVPVCGLGLRLGWTLAPVCDAQHLLSLLTCGVTYVLPLPLPYYVPTHLEMTLLTSYTCIEHQWTLWVSAICTSNGFGHHQEEMANIAQQSALRPGLLAYWFMSLKMLAVNLSQAYCRHRLYARWIGSNARWLKGEKLPGNGLYCMCGIIYTIYEWWLKPERK